MAHSAQVVQAVRASYVHERLPLEQAAEKHGVSYHTARAWKKKASEKGDNWDSARNASRMAGGNLGDLTNQILEDFALLFQTTMKDISDGDFNALEKAETLSRLSDAYAKTMRAAGGGNNKLAELSVAMKVLSLLAEFIREHYPEQLEEFTVLLEPFGVKVSEEFA